MSKRRDILKEEVFININDEITASEALYGFAAWLTTRDQQVIFSCRENAAIAADLVDEFCKANNLSDPRYDFQNRFKMPSLESDVASSNTGKISDGYHTFDELYEHRHALFVALMKSHPDISWRSLEHHDGSSYDGYFIGGIELPSGMITYHMPMAFYTLLDGIDTMPRAYKWDGHTSDDVVERLKENAENE